ncbi:chromosome segregation ATPase [Rhizobium binae]|uniref:Chromosome segregation ATPase n=1 Tax=Rhizobium binae TaxID=1138190 RepID=A0ABV2MRQ9_9HYPH|nr:hypothetical protein [Rhizobium binae]MBX4993851.1 hypothetical protein [Rhizobium binae]NKL52099.1 hypothetical protein [Rhizobium leguminosarum bv. viciae]QSY83271.1 hypothetical protein J2J99_05505 [Rhizobium binae]
MKTENFRVPPLSELDPVYKDLENRRSLLIDKQTANTREQRGVEERLATRPPAQYSQNVAELLGEAGTGEESEHGLLDKLKTLRAEAADIDKALSVINQRLEEQRIQANKLVVEASRKEYGRRVAAIVHALEGVAAARAGYDELRFQFEDLDIRWSTLGPMSLGFLGEANDGQIQRVIREAKDLGYV